MEDPGLRVQACHRGVIGHADLDAELGEPVKRDALGRPRVGRREQANRNIVAASFLQRIEEEAYAVPADERNDEIDPICGCDLLLQFRGEMRLAAAVDQKVVRREGDLWSLRKPAQPERVGRRNSDEQARRFLDLFVRAAEGGHELGDEPRALSLVDFREMRGENVRDVLRESVRLVGVIEFGQLGIETDKLTRQPSREHRVVKTRLPTSPAVTLGGYDGSKQHAQSPGTPIMPGPAVTPCVLQYVSEPE